MKQVFRKLRLRFWLHLACLFTTLVLDQHEVRGQRNERLPNVLGTLLGRLHNYTVERFPGNQLCRTSGCIRKAGQLVTYMKESVDPCDDFYEFVCGNYDSELTLQLGDPKPSVFNLAEKKFRRDIVRAMNSLTNVQESVPTALEPRFYQKIRNCFNSCYNISRLNALGLEPMKYLIKGMRGWPVLGSSGEYPKQEVIEAVNRAGFAHKNIVTLTHRRLPLDNRRKILVVGSPWSPSSDPDEVMQQMSVYLRNCSTENPAATPLRFAVELAMLFGARRHTAETQMKEVLKFECRLYNIAKQGVKDSGKSSHQFQFLDDLELDFLNFESMLPEDIKISLSDLVINESPVYFSNLKRLLDSTEDRTFHNFLIYHVVRSTLLLLSEDAANLLRFFGRKDENRALWCSEFARKRFSNGINQIYLAKYVTPEMQLHAGDMENRIRYALRSKMATVPWMDPNTRGMALAKVDAMIATVLYLDEFQNPGVIDALLNQSFYDWNADNLLFSEIRYNSPERRFLEFNQEYDRSYWKNRLQELSANAFYQLDTNSFFILPPVCQFPFFTVDTPNYLKYGSLGQIFGHEMAHAFDSRGRHHDKFGNRVKWWEPESDKNFRRISKCFENQFNNYTTLGVKIDGKATLSENMADNLGLKLAYDAWNTLTVENGVEPALPGLEHYTPNQMFWISVASTHCTESVRLGGDKAAGSHPWNPIRVRAGLSNLEEFARDFNCPLGSRMNPVDKCAGY